MKKGNLLIVDDETIIAKRLKFNLEDCADEIYTAENGLEALDFLKDNQIHCIICDINMPKMGGLEVIKNLRENKNSIPFIFYAGHGNQELMAEAYKYDAFDFLDKPNLSGLEEIVSKGLKKGCGLGDGEELDEAFLSEYQKRYNKKA